MSKRFCLFYTKNLFFLFYTIIFTKHSHQFIYYTYFFIKIIFSSLFLLFPTYPHLTHKVSASHFPLTLKLSASLSPNPQSRCLSLISQSLYISFFFFLIVRKLQGREKMMMMIMMKKMKIPYLKSLISLLNSQIP